MAVSPLDSLLATFDRHIEQKAAADQRLISAAQAGPSSLALRRNEVRDLITGSSGEASRSTSLQLSPLERAIYYEVEGRRHKLHRKQKELDFWAAYQDELADRATKMPTSRSALEAQIADKRARLMELEARDKLRIETTRALESSAAIQRVLATTSPAPSTGKHDEEHYATTREMLNQRDDQALAFLKTFNETRAIKEDRIAVKAEIREQRLKTLRLLESIKAIKAEIRARQLNPAGSGAANDSDAPQDMGAVKKVQQMQREINEARSKKELVKGILRGLILESGRDWTKNKATRTLMLSLDDEDDASDDALSDDEAAPDGDGDDEEEIDEDEDEDIDDLDEE
ncbi:uncharacterized protein PAN0_011c4337 [Moesziomyces antarcticus]|uniref:Uncharacterized protein n=2 Tax=Pseudozyma antarctica TaxID=84753 RepID=A0A5C3FR42_PSEA2|nr:uncharacterized protein PAN0_011c4337 [Moesziomyces antarcticus]GAK66115.1 conserved hypothetical protein [Moesziomyces antarcticus]SPO46893.1 uncharacterized protein PSANT_04579 [Moesziomyces antarcticus]